MENLFRKGDAYAIPFLVKSGDTVIAPANVSGVRIGFANLTASYPAGTLSFDGQCWLFPIEQNQSYGIPVGESEYQVQVQFATGEILSSPRQKVHIDSSIFRQPWGKLELDDDVPEASAVVAQIDPKPQSITAEIQQFSAGAGYVLPPATSDALGGVKADDLPQYVLATDIYIGTDQKLYADVRSDGIYCQYSNLQGEPFDDLQSALSAIEGDFEALSTGTLPSVTAVDNGKIAMVVNGKWAAVDLPTYDGGVS